MIAATNSRNVERLPSDDSATLDAQLVRAGARLADAGLVRARSGNMSVRCAERMRITAAGARLSELGSGDLVWASISAPAAGSERASSEAALHAAIYRARPDVAAIVHTHSAYVTAWTLRGTGLPLVTEDARYYGMGELVDLAPYAPAGSAGLADSATAVLGGAPAVLLERHGAVTVAGALDRAVDLAESLEHQAHVAWVARVAALSPFRSDPGASAGHPSRKHAGNAPDRVPEHGTRDD
jgi:L-fuculose-phosphate aldolase